MSDSRERRALFSGLLTSLVHSRENLDEVGAHGA